jgi:tetratricopeptide (TPR) repeat protein
LDSVKVDNLKLWLSLNYTNECESYPSKIDRFLSDFKATNNKSGNTGKFLKKLYSAVHTTFFKKYAEDTYFNEIFSNGNYNCVTASALYSLILDRFDIPYIIKVSPNHAYIIADPDNTNFLIETTLPSNGIQVIDEKTKRNYVKYLNDNKIISDAEYQQKTIDSLFTQYFTSDKTISLKELAGIQYYNKSVFYLQSEKYKEALRYIEKAAILYPDPQIKYLQYDILANILYEENNKNIFAGINLAKYLNSSVHNSNPMINGTDFFKSVSNEMIINHPDINKYKNYFGELKQNINDSVNSKDIEQTYHSLLGYYYYISSDLYNALACLGKAYKINPDNIQSKQLIAEAIRKYIFSNGEQIPQFDTLDYYLKTFPFVIKDPNYSGLYLMSIGHKIEKSVINHDKKMEDYYINTMDTFLKENPAKYSRDEIIEGIYIEISNHYYRNGDFKTAIEKLNQGLTIIPNSSTLKERKRSINTAEFPKMYIKKVSTNNDPINQNFEKLGFKKWEINNYYYYIEKNGKSQKQTIVFKLLKNGKIIFYGNGVTRNGTWEYSEKTHTLYTKSDNKFENLQITIHNITLNEIKGILYLKKKENDTMDVILTSVKE